MALTALWWFYISFLLFMNGSSLVAFGPGLKIEFLIWLGTLIYLFETPFPKAV